MHFLPQIFIEKHFFSKNCSQAAVYSVYNDDTRTHAHTHTEKMKEKERMKHLSSMSHSVVVFKNVYISSPAIL